MTADISGDQVKQFTTDLASSVAIRERLRELNELNGDRLEVLFDPFVASAPTAFEPISLTSPGPTLRGDSLHFQPASNTRPHITRFVAEQEFEGAVIAVNPVEKTFFARLVDLTAQEPEEEVEISFDDISPDDHALIVPGALFNWVIGRITEARSAKTSGQVKRISEIRFRRFFHFSPRAIAKAERQATEMFELLNDRDAP